MVRNILHIIFIFFLSYTLLLGQENDDDNLNKEVYVVKAYKPSVSDVSKINDIPVIDDTVIDKPQTEYFLSPKELNVQYELRPFKAAKMIGVPLVKLYPHYLRMGLANYTTPMLDLYTSSLRSKDFSYSANLFHESSWGKLRLLNDKKVPAHYHDTYLNLNAKKIFKDYELSGDFNILNNNYLFYGVLPNIDSLASKDDLKQNIFRVSPEVRFRSLNYMDSTRLNYLIGAKYEYTRDYYKFDENNLVIDADLDKYLDSNKLGIDGNIEFSSMDSISQSWFSFMPYISRWGDKFITTAGLNITLYSTEGTNDLYLHPNGYLEYIVGKHYFDPFVGVSGALKHNNYSSILDENPWLTPGNEVEQTDNVLNLFGGVKGNLSPKIAFNIRYEYSVLENFYMFVNDSVNVFNNSFTVVYDDVEKTRLFGEVYFRWSDRLNFMLRGNSYSYRTNDEAKAWNMPSWDLMFTTHYNLRDKIFVNLDVFGVGDRYVRTLSDDIPIKLSSYADVNLGIEYKYSKVLSGFINFYNLTASDYQRYYLYPTQRFKIMFGITYAL